MSDADWWEENRDEFQSQREAVIALRDRLQTQATVNASTRTVLERAATVSDEAEQLARLDGELRSGKPVENMSTRDIQFLIGSEEKKRLWNTVGSSRKQRWAKAIQSMPQPPAGASEHVVTTYVRLLEKVHARKKETALSLPKQAGDWYRELARREVVRTLANHIPPCSRHCTALEWSFILDLRSFMPDGTGFDPTGNYKPPKPVDEPDK